MKYIFLLTLLLVAGGVRAATPDPFATDPDAGFDTTTFGSNTYDPYATDPDAGFGDDTQTTNTGTIGGKPNQGTIPGSSGRSGGGSLAPLGKPGQTLPGFVIWFIELLNYVVIALLTAALMFFLYGIVSLMFFNASNEEARSKGKKFMMWGIVSLFVMVSVWGIVNVLKTSFFGTSPLIIPTFK